MAHLCRKGKRRKETPERPQPALRVRAVAHQLIFNLAAKILEYLILCVYRGVKARAAVIMRTRKNREQRLRERSAIGTLTWDICSADALA